MHLLYRYIEVQEHDVHQNALTSMCQKQWRAVTDMVKYSNTRQKNCRENRCRIFLFVCVCGVYNCMLVVNNQSIMVPGI